EIISSAAVILVSHQATNIRRLCDRVLWLDQGRKKRSGEAGEVLSEYENDQRSRGNPNQSSITSISEVQSVSFDDFDNQFTYGSEIELVMRVKSSKAVPLGFMSLGIVDGDTLVA